MITTAIINRKPFNSLACPEAKTACRGIATAIELADKASGKLAYYIFTLNQLFKAGKISEYPDIVSMCKELFDIGRAQTFNLIRAGSFIVEQEELNENGEPTGKFVYSDCWTQFKGKPFSNTALVRIAEFIGDEDKDTGRARRAFVNESMQNGKINSSMSVSKILAYLDGDELPAQCKKEKTVKAKATTTDNKSAETPTTPTDNKPAETPTTPTDNKPAETTTTPTDNKPAETPTTPTDEYKLTFNVTALRELKTALNSIGIDAYPELKAQLEKVNIILYGIDHPAQ